MVTLIVNGKSRTLDIPGDMPLLWTLRDVLGMTGTKFGCGAGLCGACTIPIDGQPTRSCITPASAAVGKRITTIEAIGATPAGKKIQAALLALDVPQCGYCQSGQIMSASALLAAKAGPSDSDIDDAMAFGAGPGKQCPEKLQRVPFKGRVRTHSGHTLTAKAFHFRQSACSIEP